MKDYVAEFQNKIAEISADCQNINIINAGIMDHGKSSLFNSLLDKDFFKVADVRTTVEIGTAQWRDNVYLLDTPGLKANEKDDLTAHDAYRRANMILFVHNPQVGELHENEIDAINKIKALFNNDDFFCKHFCLVLTFGESESEENINSILTKTLEDVKTHCGISEFKIFVVSNSCYQKGIAENKQPLITESGIPELRDFLIKNFQVWNSENAYFRSMRISNERNSFVEELHQERANLQRHIDSKTEQIKSRQRDFLYKVEKAVNQRQNDKRNIQLEETRLKDMKSEIDELVKTWSATTLEADAYYTEPFAVGKALGDPLKGIGIGLQMVALAAKNEFLTLHGYMKYYGVEPDKFIKACQEKGVSPVRIKMLEIEKSSYLLKDKIENLKSQLDEDTTQINRLKNEKNYSALNSASPENLVEAVKADMHRELEDEISRDKQELSEIDKMIAKIEELASR